jgi:hypothetical protein
MVIIMDEATSTEVWDLSNYEIPPRSYFYHLNPIGIGTPYVESLLSYLTRLAYEHSLPLGKLLLLIWQLNSSSPKRNLLSYQSDSVLYENRIIIFNGVREITRRWVQVSEELTSHSNFSYMTMLPWTHFLDEKKLLHPEKKWCSKCYDDWYKAKQPIYDPLLWSLQNITICPIHQIPLYSRCAYSNCNKPVKLGSTLLPIGYCQNCERWLGEASYEMQQFIKELPDLEPEEFQKNLWYSLASADLIGNTKNLSTFFLRDGFESVIKFLFHEVAKDELGLLASFIGCSGRTISNWLHSEGLIQYNKFLDLCFKIQIFPSQLITGNIQSLNLEQININFENHINLINKNVKWYFVKQREQVKKLLEEALNREESYPASLAQIKKEIVRLTNFTESRIQSNFPELCAAISEKYRNFIRQSAFPKKHKQKPKRVANKYDPGKIRKKIRALLSVNPGPRTIEELCYQAGCSSPYLYKKLPDLPPLLLEKNNRKPHLPIDKKIEFELEKIANSNEEPPPSLKEVGEQLGHCSQVLKRNFPELCNLISEKYWSYKRANGFKAIPIASEEIKPSTTSKTLGSIAIKKKLEATIAKNEFPPPSLAKVAKEGNFLVGSARKYYPDLCRIITMRHKEYRKDKRIAREKALAEATKQVVFDIFNEGMYPSTTLVGHRIALLFQIKQPFLVRSVHKSWQEALKELGY